MDSFENLVCINRNKSLSSMATVLAVFHPAIRTGSSDTRFLFFQFFFWGGHLPQAPRGGTTTAGSNAPGAFLVFFRVLLPLFSWSLAPDLQFLLSQTTIRRKLPL